MMLQEEIVFTEYFRVYCLGRKAVRIMQYEPRNQPHLRYVIDGPTSDKGGDEGLGYDFNTVNLYVTAYAIDFGNRSDAELTSVVLKTLNG
jgi:hypothetical protein